MHSASKNSFSIPHLKSPQSTVHHSQAAIPSLKNSSTLQSTIDYERLEQLIEKSVMKKVTQAKVDLLEITGQFSKNIGLKFAKNKKRMHDLKDLYKSLKVTTKVPSESSSQSQNIQEKTSEIFSRLDHNSRELEYGLKNMEMKLQEALDNEEYERAVACERVENRNKESMRKTLEKALEELRSYWDLKMGKLFGEMIERMAAIEKEEKGIIKKVNEIERNKNDPENEKKCKKASERNGSIKERSLELFKEEMSALKLSVEKVQGSLVFLERETIKRFADFRKLLASQEKNQSIEEYLPFGIPGRDPILKEENLEISHLGSNDSRVQRKLTQRNYGRSPSDFCGPEGKSHKPIFDTSPRPNSPKEIKNGQEYERNRNKVENPEPSKDLEEEEEPRKAMPIKTMFAKRDKIKGGFEAYKGNQCIEKSKEDPNFLMKDHRINNISSIFHTDQSRNFGSFFHSNMASPISQTPSLSAKDNNASSLMLQIKNDIQDELLSQDKRDPKTSHKDPETSKGLLNPPRIQVDETSEGGESSSMVEMLIDQRGYLIDKKGEKVLDDNGQPILLTEEQIAALQSNNLYEEEMV